MTGNYDQAQEAYRSFGAYLRSQRQLAQLTLRQLAELSSISNPYLSQIERGLHQPSVAVIRSIAEALNLSADALLAQVAGLDETEAPAPVATTESAIRADARLTSAQKAALLSVYRSMVSPADQVESIEDEVADETPPLATARPRPSSRRSGTSRAAPAKRVTKPRRKAEPVAPGPETDAADPSNQ